MFFLRGRRRRKLLASPLSAAERALMHENAPLTARLPADLRARHEGVVQVLLHEKHWEGAGGLTVTPAMRLAIAGQAALLQLRAGADYYPGLETVLIYPEAFVVEHQRHEGGLVSEDEDELAGESWQLGVVILAWQDVARESLSGDGYNVVLHEFAHQLDDQTGTADGTPLLPTAELDGRWVAAFEAAFAAHARRLRRRQEVLFDADAAESPTEFFATAVELFFVYPGDLAREFGDLYAVLADYLELDPAAW